MTIEELETFILDVIREGENIGIRAENRCYTDEHLEELEYQYAWQQARLLIERMGLKENSSGRLRNGY